MMSCMQIVLDRCQVLVFLILGTLKPPFPLPDAPESTYYPWSLISSQGLAQGPTPAWRAL